MAQNRDQWWALWDTAIKLKLYHYAMHMLENKLVDEKKEGCRLVSGLCTIRCIVHWTASSPDDSALYHTAFYN
jgi:hypothetical protein